MAFAALALAVPPLVLPLIALHVHGLTRISFRLRPNFRNMSNFRPVATLKCPRKDTFARKVSQSGYYTSCKVSLSQISSEEVVRAYVERCRDVNPVINAIVESRFSAAIQEAQEVDKLLASTTKTEEELARETPFLGVPITVKESFAVEGSSNLF